MSTDVSLRSQTTGLLEAAAEGDSQTVERLVPVIYEELRALAHWQLARERADHTFSTTALVHEAYMKLVDDSRVTRRGRAYFFGAAAQVMRRILVDHARRHNAAKRGGNVKHVSLGSGDASVDAYAGELLDLDRALTQLGKRSPRQVSVVECRFFGGMSVEETASVLDVSPRTVDSDWAMARAWLFRELGAEQHPSGNGLAS